MTNKNKIIDDNNQFINKDNFLKTLRKFSIKYLLTDEFN